MIGIALSPPVVRHRDGCGTGGGVSCNVTPFINELIDPAVSAAGPGSTQLAGSISSSDLEAHDVERGVSLIRDASHQAETGGSGEIIRHLDVHFHRPSALARIDPGVLTEIGPPLNHVDRSAHEHGSAWRG